MKRSLIILLILISNLSIGQVKFEDISLNEAFIKASKEGKIVFVQFVSESCKQCNEVAERAFSDKQLGIKAGEKCIAIKIDLQRTDRTSFIEKYNSDESLGSFFFTGDADLLHRTTNTTSFATAYINDIELAYNKFSEGRIPLKELDNLWATNSGDFAAMQMNLKRRAQLSLPLDSLLDVYVSLLPADSLSSFHTIQFVAKQCPIINSYASIQIRKNLDIFNQAWYQLSLQERIKINNLIIYKTRVKAIKLKDKKLAFTAANFARNVHSDPNSSNARKAYDYNMVQYYKGTLDTVSFLRNVISYCDNYFMNISKDSIRNADSLYKQKQLGKLVIDTANKKGVIRKSLSDSSTTGNTNGRFFVKQTVRIAESPYANEIGSTLSNFAKEIYTCSGNKLFTQKALGYAERAASIAENPEFYNIYAIILYKNNQINEAVEWEENAIKIARIRNYGVARYESLVRKMKLNENIDF
jgi:hypothetical protein